MIAIPATFVLSLAAALILTPLVRRLATTLGAIDAAGASARKVHKRTVPRMGGLAIAVAFYLPLVALLFVNSEVGRRFSAQPGHAIALMLGGLPILVLGVYDDLAGARAKQKFVVQFSVAVAAWALGLRIELLSLPFADPIALGWLGLPLTVFWIVGLINALNLIDGLDGLAGGVAFFGALTTLVVAIAHGNVLMALFMAALTGALLGFLVFNFNPASIFMGDTGSMFLGYVIAVTSVQTSTKGAATVALLTPILAMGLPIMDTLLAMLRRFARGQSMFSADREHIHHRLLALGLSHRRVVLIMYGASALFGLTALFMTFNYGRQTAVVLVGMLAVVAFGMRRIGFFDVRSLAQLPERRRRNGVQRRAAKLAQVGLRGVRDQAELLELLVAYGFALGAEHVRVVDRHDGHPICEEVREGADLDGTAFATGFGMPEVGWVYELVWFDGRRELTIEEVTGVEGLVAEAQTVLRKQGRPALRAVS